MGFKVWCSVCVIFFVCFFPEGRLDEMPELTHHFASCSRALELHLPWLCAWRRGQLIACSWSAPAPALVHL